MYNCLPSQLHSSHYDDNASSCTSSVHLVLLLMRTVFRSGNCWHLQHTCNLLQSLFVLVTPLDLLTSPSEPEEDELLKDSVLPADVMQLAVTIFSEAFKSFVAQMSADEEVAVKTQYMQCLQSLFLHVKNIMNNPGCSYASVHYLAQLTTDCLMAISRAAPLDEDWDVPLDQQCVRVALELVLPTEGSWAALEATMSLDYLTPSVMLANWALLPRNMTVSNVHLG